MGNHRWQTYEEYDSDFVGDTDIYLFAYQAGAVHNGPLCVVCGRTGCAHCEPEMMAEECPGSTLIDGEADA